MLLVVSMAQLPHVPDVNAQRVAMKRLSFLAGCAYQKSGSHWI